MAMGEREAGFGIKGGGRPERGRRPACRWPERGGRPEREGRPSVCRFWERRRRAGRLWEQRRASAGCWEMREACGCRREGRPAAAGKKEGRRLQGRREVGGCRRREAGGCRRREAGDCYARGRSGWAAAGQREVPDGSPILGEEMVADVCGRKMAAGVGEGGGWFWERRRQSAE